MSGLDQLYQQIILDHAKAKHGRGLRDAADGATCREPPVQPDCAATR